MKKSRNSGVEMARILFAIGVVFLHYNGTAFEHVEKYSANYYWLLLVETISVGAVDFFVMISGYYLSRINERRTIKVIELYLQAVLFNIAFYFGSIMIGDDSLNVKSFISRLIPESIFVTLYLVMYVVSPYVNLILDALEENEIFRFVAIIFVLFSVFSYLNDTLVSLFGKRFIMVSTISASGSSGGSSIINYLMLYAIGAYLARMHILVSKKTVICLLLVNGVIIFCLYLIFGIRGIVQAGGYNSPFVVLFVVFVVIYLKRLNFTNRIVNELSKATFTCYLFHSNFLTYFGINRVVNRNLFILITHQILVGVGMFVASYIVYRIYNICTGWLINKMSSKCEQLDFIVCVK